MGTITRAGTILSLTQLVEGTPPKGFLSAPECPVGDIAGALLPLYRFPVRARTAAARHVLLFGEHKSAAAASPGNDRCAGVGVLAFPCSTNRESV